MIKVIQRPSIILNEISIQYQKDTNDYDIDKQTDMLGKFPHIQIGTMIIQTTDTIQVTLYNNHFLPKIEVQFRDPLYKFIDKLFPTDNEILSLFIRSSSELLMPVRMDFKILDFNAMKDKNGVNGDIIYVITGVLNVNNLYFTPFRSYPNTSYEVLKMISEESQLGFATNINGTNDGMVWINTGEQNLNFIQDVVSHSYLDDTSFMYAYIDFYYNLNYVNIESSMNEDVSEQTGIFFSANLFNNQDKEEPEMDLFLTDNPSKSNTNQYINKYNIINSSTKVNLEIGYKSIISYYDKNGNTLYKLVMDSITASGDNNEQVILKGNVGEITELNENCIMNYNMGKIDTDNVHENYVYSYQQNMRNLNTLQKVKVKVVLNLMNFNLYRFQKIYLSFYKMDELNDDKTYLPFNKENLNNEKRRDFDEKRINKRLTGYWLITAINYTFNKISGFTQEVTLVRRELGFSDGDFE